MKRKIFCIALAIITVVLTLIAPNLIIFAADTPDIDGKSAILIDPHTGTILYEKNIHERLSMASITKLMTCLITIEMLESGKHSPDELVTVSKTAADLEGASIYLIANERVRLEDLLIATIVRSANDAAYAIAEHISGTIEEFAVLMNEKAALFGMSESHFTNPEGLEDPDNYSTTRDIAILSMEFYKHPQLLEWSGLKSTTIRNGRVEMNSSNNFLTKYEWATGLKTGYTEKAGYCLVATADKNGTELLSVVMGLPDDQTRIQESIELLDWGFANYGNVILCHQGDDMGEIKIATANPYKVPAIAIEDLRSMIPLELISEVVMKIEKVNVKAPFDIGTVIGTATMYIGDEEIASVELVSTVPTLKVNIFVRIWRFIVGLFTKD